MNEAPADKAFEIFMGELRSVLQHLYDPSEMRKTPLLALLGVQNRANPISALRQTVISAIQAHQPSADVPVHSSAWRVYYILVCRYVEQSDQRTVAANLGLSVRQLRRQERIAEQALADYLWARYDLEAQTDLLLGNLAPSLTKDSAQSEGERDREHELEWVRDSFPSEVTDVSATLQAALSTIDPLVQALQVQVDYAPTDPLPPVTGQRVLLRQALLSLLTAAVHTTEQGQVHVTAQAQSKGIFICVEATGTAVSAATGGSGAEHLQMAEQAAGVFGGTLEIAPPGTSGSSFSATLVLPITEQVPVLVIDDNVDTLHLFQRYLAGTHYRFAGVDDPAEVLGAAESLVPHAIVLDVMLPEIDGWELLGRLREHPTTQAVPVIVCTIMPQEQLALALGAAGYIRKPVSREALLSTLDREVRSRGRGSG
jgi:CheY-like chemotaxis protein/signal transduction histidine kinase